MFTYRTLMQGFQFNSEEENNAFVKEVIKELKKYK